MSLDVWFRDDIRRVLVALDDASRCAQAHAAAPADRQATSYRDGYSDALRTVAIAFGIVEPAPRAEIAASAGAERDRASRLLAAAPARDLRRP